jgi:hypothetical protein
VAVEAGPGTFQPIVLPVVALAATRKASLCVTSARCMPSDRERLARSLVDEYIEMYAARDQRLLARFSDNFSGFACSSDT